MKKRKSMRKALAMLAALLITLGQGVPAVEALTVLENNAESAIVDSGSSISAESNESSEPSEDRTADSFETTSSSQSMETEESIDESHSTEPSSSSETTEETSESTSTSESETSSSSSSASTTDSTKDSTTPSMSSTTERPSGTSHSSKPNDTTANSTQSSSEPKTFDTGSSVSQLPPSNQPIADSSQTVDLSDKLVTTPTDSNLNGYILPLLNQLANERSAALISEALNQLGKPYEKDAQGTGFNNLSLPIAVYRGVFDIKGIETYDQLSRVGKQTSLEKAVPGDLLFWKDGQQLVKAAIYLGQDKLIMADQPQAEQIVKEEKAATENNGVRIYTITDKQNSTAETKQLIQEDQVNKPDVVVHFSDSQKVTPHGQSLIAKYAASYDFRKNPQTEAFVAAIAEDARELGLTYGVYASVMIAQAILESGSGQSGLASPPYYNLFGIKGTSGSRSVSMMTAEDNGAGEFYTIQAAFRAYTGYKESLKDYVHLLRTGISGNADFYKKVWRSEAKNYLQATEYLTGRYATDTSYNNKLNSLIAVYELTKYDEAKAGSGVVLQSKEAIPKEYRQLLVFPDYNGVNYNTSGSYPVGQCTWYAYNRVKQLGGSVDEYMGNGGEWGATAKRLGYKTAATPKAGYLISFSPGTAGSSTQYGHVAFVEAVGKDGILISEGNVIDGKTISYRIIPNELAYSQSVSYIAPK
ncbi:glucosaminidase domain-containing protein [Enterococcus gallinarum]|uniref:Mannosyl-glycoprotein endo-beta-N-acetylglucosaminidase n=1 Tax=Enterococcus gallinarum TaxID=1353 RepID=A0A376H0U5_ENTGA|nr:glucosaminidase domain-containing protein [Enterococcus gallinarum]STD72945.1 mannosyl-glycoprotein endo-beta-N-acetylglucosaminidase [Enterococcus gallinarum]STD82425.1 mannosyl-glycoprotein endo-beta-N-acetylglucosaminidase [Enterococcus gallinarum]